MATRRKHNAKQKTTSTNREKKEEKQQEKNRKRENGTRKKGGNKHETIKIQNPGLWLVKNIIYMVGRIVWEVCFRLAASNITRPELVFETRSNCRENRVIFGVIARPRPERSWLWFDGPSGRYVSLRDLSAEVAELGGGSVQPGGTPKLSGRDDYPVGSGWSFWWNWTVPWIVSFFLTCWVFLGPGREPLVISHCHLNWPTSIQTENWLTQHVKPTTPQLQGISTSRTGCCF